MSPRTKEIQETYLRFARSLLAENAIELVAFEAYWAKGEFRAAYQLIEKILQTSALGNTEHYKKADQDFYWEFIA
jgi:DNA-binding GntR family transcriptional regulator